MANIVDMDDIRNYVVEMIIGVTRKWNIPNTVIIFDFIHAYEDVKRD